MFPKLKRKINKELLEHIRSLRCVACGSYPPCDADHLITRGAGGDDSLENLWPLCRKCHYARHYMGLTEFVKKNLHLSEILIEKGFYFDTISKRWMKTIAS